ncbi:MAG: enoyl-CoA hydratase/isomerase family protein, partial [Proteobacteria bacterium]|nr:enoyl-CoA hydratase/isomerase family protein [Pseudomonadota bacterium]
MSNYKTINCEQSGEIVNVTLDKPKLNLFNQQMIEELIDVFHSLRTNASARFLILT